MGKEDVNLFTSADAKQSVNVIGIGVAWHLVVLIYNVCHLGEIIAYVNAHDSYLALVIVFEAREKTGHKYCPAGCTKYSQGFQHRSEVETKLIKNVIKSFRTRNLDYISIRTLDEYGRLGFDKLGFGDDAIATYILKNYDVAFG